MQWRFHKIVTNIFGEKVALSLPVHRFQMAKYKADDICTLRLEWQRQAENENNNNNDDDDKKCKQIRKFEALGNWALILFSAVGYTIRVLFSFPLLGTHSASYFCL